MEITFTNLKGVLEEFKPKPASRFVPEWYRDTPSFTEKQGQPRDPETGEGPTIKKCLPVFDMITAGYIIPFYSDVYIKERNASPFYTWPSQTVIELHNPKQAEKHPLFNGFPFPKLINPWAIKTPKGYSCLFMQPAHHDLPFYILPAIVDTDKYTGAVHFPFVLKNAKFEGMITAGTPMVQIIPIKRDKWTHKFGNEEDFKRSMIDAERINYRLLHAYKNIFREKKEYL